MYLKDIVIATVHSSSVLPLTTQHITYHQLGHVKHLWTESNRFNFSLLSGVLFDTHMGCFEGLW